MPALGCVSTASAGDRLAMTLASSAADAAQIQAFEPVKKDAIGPGSEYRGAALEHFQV
jgi:hypothetical protein